MYKVTLYNGNTQTIIHYPSANDDAPHLLEATLQEKIGQVHNFNFTIPIFNVGYNYIFDLVTLVKVENIKTNDIVFEGRVYNSVESMSAEGEFYKEVICESELAYLNDTRVRAWNINNSVLDFITQVVNNHNSHTTIDKAFTVGRIEVAGNLNLTTKFENSLNVLIDKMVNVLEVGYLIVRKEDGIRYLDYVPQIASTDSANINLGINMKDISFSKDVSILATRLIPVGKDNLTIASVNAGKDYLEDSSAVSEFGIIEQVIEFTDIDNPSTLKSAGQTKLNNISKAIYKLNTNVLDLNTIGLDSNTFFIGTDTNITCDAIGFNQAFTIIQKDTDLLNPQNCTITLNDKFETLTDRQISLQRVAQYVEKCLTADKQLNTFYLEGVINNLKNKILASAAYDNATVIEDQGILLENTKEGSPDYGCLYLGCNIFAIAKEKVGGVWNFRTFGNGSGFTADLINVGTLNAGLVNVINIKADNINTGTLDASIVNVIKLNATNITTGAMNASLITTGTLDASKANITNINASNINVGTLNGENVNITNLNADHINAGSITVPGQWSGSKGTVYANSGGLYNTYGGSTNDYKSLVATGTGTVSISDGAIYVSLPSVFYGKTYSVIVAARTAVTTSGFTLWTNPSSWHGGTFSVQGGTGDGLDSIAFSWVAIA